MTTAVNSLPTGVVPAIRIATEAGLQLIEIDPERNVLRGLALHRSMRIAEKGGLTEHQDGSWTITHIATGMAVVRGIYAESDAREAMRVLDEAFDWTEAEPQKFKEAAKIRTQVLDTFDTVKLREMRMNIARDLGKGGDGDELPGAVKRLNRKEVEVLHAITRFRTIASDIAVVLPDGLRAQYKEKMTREVLRVLSDLEKRGYVRKIQGRPVTWQLKVMG